MTGLFSSCDEDEKKGLRLSGEWEGDFYSYYTYTKGNDPTVRTAWSDCTYMHFYTDGFDVDEGEGYEVDFYKSGPYDYLYYRFFWKVQDGIISLSYPGNHDMDVDIYDYHLTYNHFAGRFGEGHEIDLKKLNSYSFCEVNYYEYWEDEWSWDRCTNDYGYFINRRCNDYDKYHWTRTNTEIEPEEELPLIISQGRKVKPNNQ